MIPLWEYIHKKVATGNSSFIKKKEEKHHGTTNNNYTTLHPGGQVK